MENSIWDFFFALHFSFILFYFSETVSHFLDLTSNCDSPILALWISVIKDMHHYS
jgi:hypothetical protein